MASDPAEETAVGPEKVRVAVVQAAPVLFDARESLRKLADLTADAARRGAELVVFPEAFIAGYPKGHDFGVSVGVRSPEGRDEFRRLFEAAIEVPGDGHRVPRHGRQGPRRPPRRRRGRAGRRDAVLHGPHLRPRRHPARQAPQAGADGDGAGHLGQRRRVDPPGRGHEARQDRLGHLLGELHAPAADGDVRQGGRAVLRLTVDDRDTWLPTVTHIALEGRCFVLSACQFLRRADLPAGYPTGRLPADQDVVIRGGSCVIGPLGQLLAGPKYGEECIVTADLDRADLARAKFDFDVVGHYARPDVFRLEVDERPMRSVWFR